VLNRKRTTLIIPLSFPLSFTWMLGVPCWLLGVDPSPCWLLGVHPSPCWLLGVDPSPRIRPTTRICRRGSRGRDGGRNRTVCFCGF